MKFREMLINLNSAWNGEDEKEFINAFLEFAKTDETLLDQEVGSDEPIVCLFTQMYFLNGFGVKEPQRRESKGILDEIIMNYIYDISLGHDRDLETEIKYSLKSFNKTQLKELCDKEMIFYRKYDSKDVLLDRIYGSCSNIIGSQLLKHPNYLGMQEVYTKIYKEYCCIKE